MRVLLLFIAVGACGTPLPADFGEFCRDYSEAWCASCGRGDECVDSVVDGCCDELDCTTDMEGRFKGRAEYNQCLDDMRDATCDTEDARPASCQTMWE